MPKLSKAVVTQMRKQKGPPGPTVVRLGSVSARPAETTGDPDVAKTGGSHKARRHNEPGHSMSKRKNC